MELRDSRFSGTITSKVSRDNSSELLLGFGE